ncbi:MAG: hypothetical protein FJY85_09895 [Deltaproteobacteria bacterium]|nr:hypothetical protein [Deltaproteobacteria bacterium]
MSYTWDDETRELKADFRDVIPELVVGLNANADQGKQLIGEFARTLRGISSCSPRCYMAFREHILEIDPELGWVFDTGGLPVYEHPHQGTRWWSPHIEGTDNADAIRGSLTEGDGWINGLNGRDVIYGTGRNEQLINETGDALLDGGGGNDTIWAGADNDILDGGAGRDTLFGEGGNDTYIFRRGSGQDVIVDTDATAGNTDTIWLGSNLTPAEIVLRRAANNLVLKIAVTTDSLTVQDFFRSDRGLNRIERIQFMDGTAWDVTEIFARAYAPTEYDDYIYGTNGDDNLSGAGGNDTLYGQAGNDTVQGDSGADRLFGGPGADTVNGGTGNDTLEGGTGNDTYFFTRGSGQDTVVETDTTPGNIDTILLGEGILPADIRVERMRNDLRLTISDTADSITIKNWAQADVPGFGVESVRFADGTEWGTDTIADMVVTGTAANDTLTGFTRADTMEGSGGNDTLYARAGDDTVRGGDGSDTLFGETGNDTIARDQLYQNRSFSWTEECSEWYM